MRFSKRDWLLVATSMALSMGCGDPSTDASSELADPQMDAMRRKASGTITALPSSILSASPSPGQSFALTYHFSGGPTAEALTVFVHFLDGSGNIAFGDDHVPPTPTTLWTGEVTYSRTLTVPAVVAGGVYRIGVGLYSPTTGARLTLQPGAGVVDLGSMVYQVGSVTVATTSPAPPPSNNTQPQPALSQRTIHKASSYGVVCDGARDDTAALQSALNALATGEALELPAGTCVTSSLLQVYGKSNVVIYGAGRGSTILKATNTRATSFVVTQGNGVFLQDFQVYAPNTTGRLSDAVSRGFYVENSGDVHLIRVQATNVAGAGMLFYVVHDSSIENSEVAHSWADAFHVTGGSTNVTLQSNHASQPGDDCFASIGYQTSLNQNIYIYDNACEDGNASGVSYEGTVGGKAYRNTLTRTGVAGIRIDSQNSWSTGTVSTVDVSNNTLIDVRTRLEVDHAAVMIYTDRDELKNLTVNNNVIQNPNTWAAFRVFGSTGALIHDSAIQGNQVTDVAHRITDCMVIGAGTSALTITGNTLNGGACL